MKARWIVLVLALVAVAVYFWGPFRSKAAPVTYREAAVTRGAIRSQVSATGTLNPVDQVEIGSQVSGTIQRLYVDYNSRVRAGQVLAQIDPAILKANRSQAEASVERAKVALADAERTLRRSRELKEQGLVAQVDLDTAESAFDSRRADLRQAQAALELAQVNVANTTITSPINGIVISRSIDVGQTVAASLQSPKLFVIARDLAEMELEARVDEADIGQVAVGQPVTFTVDSYPDRVFEGQVLQVRAEPIAEAGVVSYVTLVRVPNRDGKLLPGMTANVTIVTASRDDVLRVPNAALRFRPKAGERDGEERPGSGATASAGGGGMRERAGAQAATRTEAGRGEGTQGRRSGDGTRGGRRSGTRGAGADSSGADPAAQGRSSTVYRMTPGAKTPEALRIRTGITDGTWTEVVSGQIDEGAQVVVGEIDNTARRAAPTNPLGGGGGPGGGGGRGGGGRRGP